MQKNLTLSGAQAHKIYPTATPEMKAILDENFGKEYFSQKITDRVKILDDVYEVLGEPKPSDDELLRAGLSIDEIKYRHLKALTKALNEGWTPDMYDTDERKYYPWFEVGSSSFAFDAATYGCSTAHAGCASRLCFKSAELARYAGEQFTHLYEEFITK